MKKLFFLAICLFFSYNINLFSQQEQEDKFNPFKVDTVKAQYNPEGYERTFTQSFETVWNTVIKAIDEQSCQILQKNYNQTTEGYYKGKIFSDYCVIVGKTDSTWDVLKKYSVQIPIIRGGVWASGRIQYKFWLTEQPNGTTIVKLKGEISGMEEHATAKVHFWESNGILERQMLNRIQYLLDHPSTN
ncbi:MAG TPA: hypothetical protein P5545_01700 [Bacteroidota bacterium]|nr:hypothetical protein [Candidatus Kapabacteria bacterium]HRS01245.1 hypothetical protein [Bacteroidota bacterium]